MLKDQYKKIILDICNKHLSEPYKLYLFGSRARGDEYFCSDIDLAIETNEKNKTWKYGLIKEDFHEARIPFTIDFVDIEQTNETMMQSILEDRILLNEKIKV